MTNRSTNMAIAFSEEQAMVLDSAKDFCSSKSDITKVRSLLDSKTGFTEQVWTEMAELGWAGIAIPEQYGGSGLGIGAVVPLIESMGRHLLTTPLISSTIASQAIARGGSEQQKQQWLSKLAGGAVGTMALLDNEDFGASTSTCLLEDQGNGLELQGSKLLVADAAVADVFVVSASHNDKQVLVLVDASHLGTNALTSNTLIDETKRACTVNFSGLKVSADSIMPDSETALRDSKLIGALLLATEAAGTCAATLDCVVDYLTSRIQFGRLIGSYQALKHPTVDMLIQMDSARTLIYHAATVIGEGPLDKDSEIACRMAKAQATDALMFAGDRAIQFHGGMGFTYDCNAQLYLRRALWSQHQYGDAQHHRNHLAKLLLD